MVDMHGHTRLVERKIRVWIADQELNRRKEGQSVRINTREDAPAARRLRVGDLPRRKQ
jgi:hypothetical protein